MAFNVISLEDMYNALGVEKTKNILGEFECDLNKDVEDFIKDKAITFSKMNIARTFLVTTKYKGKDVIADYFSLANKTTRIKKSILSYGMQKRLARYSEDIEQNFVVSLPLIGQLGKNFKNGYNDLISGDELLKLACDKVKEAQNILGR